MKTKLTILFLLCLCTLSAAGQTITRQKCATCGKLKVQCPYKGNHPVEKKCASCGKVISKCQYKGNHPKSMPEKACTSCGKVISNCPYRGKHPSKPSINTTNNATATAPSGYENGHEWVDLGLSVKWATCNVGASTPTEYGGYYAWGETSEKNAYDWSSYKWCSNGSWEGMTKYTYPDNQTEGIWYSGNAFVGDRKTTLELSDDAAHANWGGSWRMPTRAEQDELREKCTLTWTTQNGVKGYKVSSKRNGNSIFLPAAGWCLGVPLIYDGSNGYYWSSSLNTSHSYYAYDLNFSSDDVDNKPGSRICGLSVRAVCP